MSIIIALVVGFGVFAFVMGAGKWIIDAYDRGKAIVASK